MVPALCWRQLYTIERSDGKARRGQLLCQHDLSLCVHQRTTVRTDESCNSTTILATTAEHRQPLSALRQGRNGEGVLQRAHTQWPSQHYLKHKDRTYNKQTIDLRHPTSRRSRACMLCAYTKTCLRFAIVHSKLRHTS